MRLNFKRLALLGAHAARGLSKVVDLTPARLDFLTMLVDGPLCQRDLAARLCVSEPVISRMVRALMRSGLVARVIPAADRRFRVVSLTDFGRYEYRRLMEGVWFAEEGYDAQSLGECLWCVDWDGVLAALRLDFLAGLHEIDRFGEGTPAIPFAAMRRHHRRGVYRDPIRGSLESAVDTTNVWSIRDNPPPLHLGLLVDPVSAWYLAAWRLPHGSLFVPPPPPVLST